MTDGVTGLNIKLIHSFNVSAKVNDLVFGRGNIVLVATEENRLTQDRLIFSYNFYFSARC